jgi:amino acid adenylation domain-containing protein
MDGSNTKARKPGGRARLSLLSEAEKHRLLHTFNDTAAPYRQDLTIHEIFEAQVEATPDAVAVIYEGQQLTYAELNSRANRIANALVSHGVRPDDRVAVYAERSVDTIQGLLGVLKSGGAYVPLDPTYPADRLAFMLHDSAPVVVLAQREFAESVASFERPYLLIDEALRQPDQRPVIPALTSRNLAYMIYTSGTTGQPKGVVIEHRSAGNLVNAQAQLFNLSVGSRMLQFASPSFDASLWEMLMALCRGASLVVPPKGRVLVGDALFNQLVSQQITHALLPPVVLQSIKPSSALSSFSTIVVGGEACPATLVDQWAPGRVFINAYGPTEITVYATLHKCTAGTGAAPPIGQPIANARIRILDKDRNLVPVGIAGEIYIGGSGVARGYLNRPELTAERFVRDPFDDSSDARLYRSGDLGRWRSDGTIEYLGRDDFQVKIRGFRVELGEIEAAMQSHNGVKTAVVTVRTDTQGERRLAGYVVADLADLKELSRKEVSAENVSDWIEFCRDPENLHGWLIQRLRRTLQEKLPAYMVPADFVVLDKLPLTGSGKVDRPALPEPPPRQTSEATYVEPRTATEAAVVQILKELLTAPQVSVDDNFFELGGHSLLAAKLVALISDEVGVELSVMSVFRYPTAELLASAIDSLRLVDQKLPLPEGAEFEEGVM